MGDDARGWLEDEIEESRAHARMLDYLADTIDQEASKIGRRKKGELHARDAIGALLYAAECCRQHAENLSDARALWDARVLEPVEEPNRAP